MDVVPGRDLGALRGHPGGGWLSYQLQAFLELGWLLKNAAKRQIWVTPTGIFREKALTKPMNSADRRFPTAWSRVFDEEHSFFWLVCELAA